MLLLLLPSPHTARSAPPPPPTGCHGNTHTEQSGTLKPTARSQGCCSDCRCTSRHPRAWPGIWWGCRRWGCGLGASGHCERTTHVLKHGMHLFPPRPQPRPSVTLQQRAIREQQRVEQQPEGRRYMENRVYKARDSNKSATWNRLYNFLLDGVLLLKTLFMWWIYSVLSLKKKKKDLPTMKLAVALTWSFT